jgi:hypothetical protein
LVETSDAAAPASNAVENLRLFMIIPDSFRDKAHASGGVFRCRVLDLTSSRLCDH